jgi:pimeloyl-ACP methyl ester carboxylesterase
VDLPGFGGSRRRVSSLRPPRVAAQLLALLDALRVPRVDVAAAGWGVTPAEALAARAPLRVRRLVAISASAGDAERDPESLRAEIGARIPAELPAELRAELAAELAHAPARNLRLAARAARRRVTPLGVGLLRRVDLAWSEALGGARLFAELGPD